MKKYFLLAMALCFCEVALAAPVLQQSEEITTVSTKSPDDTASKEALVEDKEKVVSTVKFHRPMKERLTSFGAAVLGEYLYVFSGHDGEAHGFGKDQLCNHFRRIKFDDPKADWEDLAMHDPAQSVALVSDGEYLYRIGGLSFLNADSSEKANFKSTDYFARYDVEKNEWKSLPSLPSPRSSLDAAVVGRKVFVAGGWNLQGEGSRNAEWRENILEFDLDLPEAGWKEVEGPGYKSRAISTAAYNGKFYLFGGIQDRGMTRKVSVYDPESESWSEAPELVADNRMAGFATSSFATGGKLYVTGYSGIVYALSEDEKEWEHCGRLMYPRFFLRLLPAGDDRLLAVGGSSSIIGRTASIESFEITDETPDMRITQWSVDFGGKAKHSQSLLFANNKLYAFGGNASRRAHDFSEDAFVDESFVFDLESRSCEPLAKMPQPVQSGLAIKNRKNSEHSELVVAGGLGIKEDGEFGSLDTVYSFDPEGETWQECSVKLPQPRAMFHGFYHEDAVWMIGGSDAGHGAGLDRSVLHWWGDDSDIATLPNVELPNARRSFGGVVVDNKYYVIGGLGDGIVEQLDVLDLESRIWSEAASPEKDRVFPTVCAIGSKIYLYGGFCKVDGHFAPATSLEVFDTAENKWSTLVDDLSEYCGTMSMMAAGDRLLFYGVDKEKDGVANFVVLDPDPQFVPVKAETMSFGGRYGRRGRSSEDVKMLMRRDNNRDGKLDAEELGSRLNSLIADGDKNKDGALDRAEVKELMESGSE